MRLRPIFFIFIIVGCALIFTFIYYVPARATLLYGAPAGHLSISSRIGYSTRLLWHGDALKTPLDLNGTEQTFRVESGERAASVAERLQEAGLISNARVFLDYVVYSGIDRSIQSGDFKLSAAQSVMDIAKALQKFNPSDALLAILPGWRMEEIAAALPTSGLSVEPQAFLSAAQNPPPVLAFAEATSMEGFFFPDTYALPRTSSLENLLDLIARNFVSKLTPDLERGFSARGLSVYQGVILASIVQREAVKIDEAPLIASVYLNRFAIGMKLDADPTVQYALGFQPDKNSWWKSPLAWADLEIVSPYNTYLASGLPPTPISNPSLEALKAVAYPQDSPYYYFRAACNGDGYHIFAETYEEQLSNGCP